MKTEDKIGLWIRVAMFSAAYIAMFILVGWKIGFGILLGFFASNIEKQIRRKYTI